MTEDKLLRELMKDLTKCSWMTEEELACEEFGVTKSEVIECIEAECGEGDWQQWFTSWYAAVEFVSGMSPNPGNPDGHHDDRYPSVPDFV